MKKILIAAALIVSGLLSGCNQLTQYTVSEQEINQALQKRNHFAKDIGLKGVADAHIELQNLTSAIGREEPGKVTLSGIANVDLNSLFGTQKATIDLKLKALPTFDREKGAIFLQEMEVVDAKVAPGEAAVGYSGPAPLPESVSAQLLQPAARLMSCVRTPAPAKRWRRNTPKV